MFFIDFFNEVNVAPYLFSLLFFMSFLFFFDRRRGWQIIDPIRLLDLVFFQSTLLLIFHSASTYSALGVGLLLFYILTRVFSIGLFGGTRRIEKNYAQKKIKAHNLILYGSSFAVVYSALYLVFIINTNADTSNQAFKIIWVNDYPYFSVFYEYFKYAGLANVIFFAVHRLPLWRLWVVGLLVSLVASSVVLHEKSIFILLIFTYFIYLRLVNIKISKLNYLILFSFVAPVLMLFYGSDYLEFIFRVVKGADGVFIVLNESYLLNEKFSIPFLAYVFKFIAFKLGYEGESIGAIIGGYSGYMYPPNGGPNDHLILYVLLDFNLVVLMLYLLILVIFFSFLRVRLINYFGNYYIFLPAFYLFVSSFSYVQSVSSAFLSGSKFLFVHLVLSIICILISKGAKLMPSPGRLSQDYSIKK